MDGPQEVGEANDWLKGGAHDHDVILKFTFALIAVVVKAC